MQLEIPAGKVGRDVAAEHPANNLKTLLKTIHTVGEIKQISAIIVVLTFLPAGANAQGQPST